MTAKIGKIGEPYVNACHCGQPKHTNWTECNNCIAGFGCATCDARRWEEAMMIYLMYLQQLLLQGRPWDTPCVRFEKGAAELLRRSWIRRRWWWPGGKVRITKAGLEALIRKSS